MIQATVFLFESEGPLRAAQRRPGSDGSMKGCHPWKTCCSRPGCQFDEYRYSARGAEAIREIPDRIICHGLICHGPIDNQHTLALDSADDMVDEVLELIETYRPAR